MNLIQCRLSTEVLESHQAVAPLYPAYALTLTVGNTHPGHFSRFYVKPESLMIFNSAGSILKST